MTIKLALSIIISGLVLIFICQRAAVHAANLGALPVGSVIQIMGTDTGMCDDYTCSTATSPVLPYRFVKMQAHRINTSGGDELVGGNGNCNMGNCTGYSYFMLLDNYCWWGSADCRIGYNYNEAVNWQAGDRSIYQAFNGNCTNWVGSACTTDTTGINYSNNISDPKGNNILIKLANFYNSLPDNIGGRAKTAAIANYNWDMIGVNWSPTTTPTVGWYTGAGTNNRTWPATPSYTSNGVTFNFTGSNTVANPPIMTSRIGLLGYTEWQAGLYGYSSYPVIPGGVAAYNPTTFHLSQIGSGSTFCKTRFNSYNCNLNNNGANAYPNPFNANNSFTYRDDDNTSILSARHSAANPKPRHPWFRTPNAGDAVTGWYVYAGSAANSVNARYTFDPYGVSPALWLASDIEVLSSGEGSYVQPYCLEGGYCQSGLTISSTSGSTAAGVTLSGTANGSAANQDIVVQAAVCNTAGECMTKSTTLNTGSKNASLGWNLNWLPNELPPGTYAGTIWANEFTSVGGNELWLAAAQSAPLNFNISPRQLDLTVVRNQPFQLILGDAAIFNLPPGTNQGVTVAVDPATNQVSASGTLPADTQITFGSVILNFKTFVSPRSTVINASLN